MTSPHRLPRDLVPTLYRLRVRPDLSALTFTGEVSVDLRVKAPVDRVVLNCLDVDIEKVELKNSQGGQVRGRMTV